MGIVINKTGGGLGRPPLNEDYISAFLFFGTAPTGWNTNGIEEFLSVQDAINKGLDGNSSDATAGTTELTVSVAGANGDTVSLGVNIIGGFVDFGTYTVQSGATVDLVAEGLRDLVNANTLTHGFSATATTGVVTITAPLSSGVGANTYTNEIVNTGTVVTAETSAWAGGVGSTYDVWAYHIEEYFRLKSNGKLFVGVFNPATFDYAELTTMQSFAEGKIRQFAIWNTRDFVTNAVADLGSIEAQYDINFDTVNSIYRPFAVLYATDISGVSDLTTLPDLQGQTAEHTTAVIGQDGASKGKDLYNALGSSISSVGAVLGAVSEAQVNESIGWVGKFNMAVAGGELDNPALGNGVLTKMIAPNSLTALENKSYLLQTKYDGINGSYNNDSYTSIARSSDFATIENNRTIDKSVRLSYIGVLPLLNSPILVNADGTLTEDVLQTFKQSINTQLDGMLADQEVSAYEVLIDPSQDVISTGQVCVSLVIVPVGVAREIKVNIGFTTSL